MNHASAHPCTWCVSQKNNLETVGELRTISRITNNYNNYKKKNNKKEAQKFENCVNTPIITSERDRILEILPPPELHLLLGTVNHLFNHMDTEFPTIASQWAKECNVFRVDIYRGTLGFHGNSCKTLLRNVDKLRRLSNCYDLNCLKFVDTFEKFRKVVDSCFSLTLHSKYTIYIHDFKISFLKLNISTTSKIHATFFHVQQFCEVYGLGLGFYSEQAFETVYNDFNKSWQNFKVINVDNSAYGDKLLRGVCTYNSRHL